MRILYAMMVGGLLFTSADASQPIFEDHATGLQVMSVQRESSGVAVTSAPTPTSEAPATVTTRLLVTPLVLESASERSMCWTPSCCERGGYEVPSLSLTRSQVGLALFDVGLNMGMLTMAMGLVVDNNSQALPIYMSFLGGATVLSRVFLIAEKASNTPAYVSRPCHIGGLYELWPSIVVLVASFYALPNVSGEGRQNWLHVMAGVSAVNLLTFLCHLKQMCETR